MSVHSVCKKFFCNIVMALHKYLQNALRDAITGIVNGASLSPTSTRRNMLGGTLAKNKTSGKASG